MDFGSKLEELNLTRDEMNRFGEALKDEKFRELLQEYATEISDPENRRKYEEEITRLEEDRGVRVHFIHPHAHHVLKTRSARGKCFVNICSNPRIDEPACTAARARDGTPGHNWRLPFSLTPGRTDIDAAGNSCEIYDVVFHPHALHMASKNARFMKLIHSTAIDGIEDSFHIKLHRDQLKRLKMSYKGVAHPAVIREPIPGHQNSRKSGEDMLAFPYPDQNPREPEPTASQSPNDDTPSNLPIKPHYTVKYRSVVDLQDYRCSRDSGPGTRPREIVVIVDVPLLSSALDAEVRVTEQRLILEAPEPAYRLELLLAYPVDEDAGDAKFNRAKKQLTITLPVRPGKSPELHWIGCDQEPNEEDLDPDLTESKQSHNKIISPAENWTEPQEPEPQELEPCKSEQRKQELQDLELCKSEQDSNPEDELSINRVVDSSSDSSLYGGHEREDGESGSESAATEDDGFRSEEPVPRDDGESGSESAATEEDGFQSKEPVPRVNSESAATERLMKEDGFRSEEPVLRDDGESGSESAATEEDGFQSKEPVPRVNSESAATERLMEEDWFQSEEPVLRDDGENGSESGTREEDGFRSEEPVLRDDGENGSESGTREEDGFQSKEPVPRVNSESAATERLMKEDGFRSEEPVLRDDSESGAREEDGFWSEEPVPRDAGHRTSAALCFQNSLWFELD